MEKVVLEQVKKKAGKKGLREFTQEEARNLLDFERRRGFKEWQLPENSPYQLSQNGDLIKRGGPKVIEGAETSGGDTASKGEEGEA
jgi:hypothetical protein